MKIKINTLLLLLFFYGFASGQTSDERLLIGKIVVDTLKTEGINVLNARTEKTAVTNELGIFSIPVKVGDALVFSAVNLETKRKVIEEDDFKSTRLLIKMSIKMNPIEEVVVNDNQGVTAENLGIIPVGQKKYSPAERKVRTATTGLLDPLLNKMSGRTSMLKKEVQVEQEERLLRQLDGWFQEKYYIETLKIPKEYIRGFQYYIVDDVDFARALKAKNKTLTKFLAKGLAVKFVDDLEQETPPKGD